jgi:hypothetical protein
MEELVFEDVVGNICKCKNVYYHEECALKWFTPKVKGISKGYLIENNANWSTNWYACCDVCNSMIEDSIVKKCIFNFNKKCLKMLNVHNGRIHPIPRTEQNNSFFSCFSNKD